MPSNCKVQQTQRYRDGAGVRLITRHGNDFTARFPLAAAAVSALSARSFLIDGEAIVTDDKGLAVFELIRRQRHGAAAVLCAFDLIELDGEDLRRSPIEQRKHKLARLVRGSHPGIVLNEHYEGDGEIVFQHACKLGCEGIVSKRPGSIYRRGRSPLWLKVKNPHAPAVKREAEEDWGRIYSDRQLIIGCATDDVCGHFQRPIPGEDYDTRNYRCLDRTCEANRRADHGTHSGGSYKLS